MELKEASAENEAWNEISALASAEFNALGKEIQSNSNTSNKAVKNNKVGQEQIHALLFSETLSWQAIIYDLINTEQLDPWDIDISLLAKKFLEKVKQLEEANFFISSKVLFASSLLLRIKSEILLERELQNLDDILFGKKEEKKYIQERIELDEEIPELLLRTPLPRFRKVTLEELMKALDVAIKTETRRIKRVVLTKQQEFETSLSLPKQRINIQDSIQKLQEKLEYLFRHREHPVKFSQISGRTKEEKVSAFMPLLHLDAQHKIWTEQEGHCSEIWILLKYLYEQKNAELLARLKAEVEAEIGKLDVHEEEALVQEELTPEEEKRFNASAFTRDEELEDEI